MDNFILIIGVMLQVFSIMLKLIVFKDIESGYVFMPTILMIIFFTMFPFFEAAWELPVWGAWQWFLVSYAGVQFLLFVLKITISPNLSWWLVFSPLLVILVAFLGFHRFVRHMEKTKPEGYC
jgi:hypothetical protein